MFWIIDSVQNGTDMTQITYLAPCATLSGVASIKSIYLIVYGEHVERLIEELATLEKASVNSRVGNKEKIERQERSTANTLEVIYSKSTLFNFVSSSVIICLTGFNVTAINNVAFAVTFLTFLFMSLLQIFFLCLFGDMIMRSSLGVSDAVYNSLWYEAGEKVGRDLLLVQIRAQKPCKLTALGFADVNLRSFTKIISTAWSYFALLNTMYNSDQE
ncbi:unnamed protein product, partial [Iphiclides podalirius]